MNERLNTFLEYVTKSMQDPKFRKLVDYLNELGDAFDYMDYTDWEYYCESDEFFDDVDYAAAKIRKMI